MAGGAKQQSQGIVTPHEHDVLSGRGNFVNYHAGNEHFRALVRKHKLEYVRCPKPQKGKFSRMIVDEIKSRNPPGRFLKQDATTKLWYDIGEKKALDKTRQALREGAPEIMKDIVGEDGNEGDADGIPPPKNAPNPMCVPSSLTGVSSEAYRQASGGGAGGNMSQDTFLCDNPNAATLQPDSMQRNGTGMNVADTPQQFMASGLGSIQSPVMDQRHHLSISPQFGNHLSPLGGLGSPGTMGMPHTPLSPDAANSMSMNLQAKMQQQIAASQMQLRQLEQQSAFHEQQSALHKQLAQQQQQIMTPNQPLQMNVQSLMMNQVGQQGFQSLRNDLEVLRMKQRQLEILQAKQREMQAMQDQLTAAYYNEPFEPRPIDPNLGANTPVAGKMRKPKSSLIDDQVAQVMQQHQQQQQQHARALRQSDRAALSTQSEHGPRRKPPPVGLKRENSLKIEKVFVNDGTSLNSNSKKKHDGNGSSAHLSAMSLSIGDMGDDAGLSSMFDNSLQISTDEAEFRDTLSPLMRKKPGIPSLTNAWDGKNPFDMSAATLGDKASDAGNMSVNTFAEKMGESESNMSFSKVFEDGGET